MSELIKVRFGILAITHDSFERAIQGASRQELVVVNGQILVEYEFNGHDLVLRLDNNKCCYISIGDNCITCSVGDNFRLSEKSNLPTDAIFEYPSGENQEWDWKIKLEGLIGKKIALSPSDQFLFLHSEDRKEYIFNCVESIMDPSMKYLYISDV